jgi:hypothetical protein
LLQAGLIGAVQPVAQEGQVLDEHRHVESIEGRGELGRLFADQGIGKAAAEVARVAGVDHRIGVVLAVVVDARVGQEQHRRADRRAAQDALGEGRGGLDGLEQTGAAGGLQRIELRQRRGAPGPRVGEHAQAILRAQECHPNVGRQGLQLAFERIARGRNQRQIAGQVENDEQQQGRFRIVDADNFRAAALDGGLDSGGVERRIAQPGGDAAAQGGS